MRTIKNILVLVDLLQSSNVVVEKATKLAEIFDATLYLIHITAINTAPLISETGRVDATHNSDEIKIRQLNQYKERLNKLNIKNDTILVKGNKLDNINSIAENIEADVIVLGLRKHDAFYNIIVGSTAQHLIKKAQYPLLLIPHNVIEKKEIKNILVPIDFSTISSSIAKEALAYAKNTQAKINLIHVLSTKVGVEIGEAGYVSLSQTNKAKIRKEIENIEQYKKYFEQNKIVNDCYIKQGDIVEVILEEIDIIKADLLIIGSLGHGTLYKVFIGSVASGIIKQTDIPILLVPQMD